MTSDDRWLPRTGSVTVARCPSAETATLLLYQGPAARGAPSSALKRALPSVRLVTRLHSRNLAACREMPAGGACREPATVGAADCAHGLVAARAGVCNECQAPGDHTAWSTGTELPTSSFSGT